MQLIHSSMARHRYYHRFLRKDDLPQLEEASKYLFAFDPHEVSLKDVIRSDRWFCLAAVSAGPEGEQIVGFVAAALGAVKEFPQEQQHLQAFLSAAVAAAVPPGLHLSSSSSSDAAREAASTTDHGKNSSVVAAAASPDSSSSSSSSDALALEVVLLGVIPEYRRRGVASRLLKQVKTHARTRGAALMFLHVQTTNTPARSLYHKAGFAQAGVLPEYYSFRSDLQQQQQQQGPAAAAAAMQSTWGLDEFSGNDAALLVMRLARSSFQMGDSAAAAAAAATSTGSSSSSRISSISGSNSDLEELAAAVAASSRSSEHPQLQQQQQPFIASSSSSSDLRSAPDSPSAAEAVSAAAAAARLLLGPAIGLLGLAPKPRSRGLRNQQLGRRGELVDLGNDELMVQVREGSNVFVFDPDELPADVLLSDRDRALLKQQQQDAVAQIQQQQQQHSHEDGDQQGGDDAGSGNAAGTQQQHQQEASATVSAAPLQHLDNASYEQPCYGKFITVIHERQRQQQQQRHPLSLHEDLSQHVVQHTCGSRHSSHLTAGSAQRGTLDFFMGYRSVRPLPHGTLHCCQQQVDCTSRPSLAVAVEAHAPYGLRQQQQRQQQRQWQITSQPRGLLRALPAGMPAAALSTALHKTVRCSPTYVAARGLALA